MKSNLKIGDIVKLRSGSGRLVVVSFDGEKVCLVSKGANPTRVGAGVKPRRNCTDGLNTCETWTSLAFRAGSARLASSMTLGTFCRSALIRSLKWSRVTFTSNVPLIAINICLVIAPDMKRGLLRDTIKNI